MFIVASSSRIASFWLRLMAFQVLACTIAICAILDPFAAAEPVADRAALLDFIAATPHEAKVAWNTKSSACEWTGVSCSADRSAVIELRLPGAGLGGRIPAGTLGRLSSLSVLSLRNNRLSGELPADIAGLASLQHLYLQNNLFSGGFPPWLAGLTRLLLLDLSENNFTGEIPLDINNLTRVTGLYLENNKFSGKIPSISLPLLNGFNVSYNNLNGSIPKSLDRFPASSFTGNLQLCGPPLPPCPQPFPPSPSPAPAVPPGRKRKLYDDAILVIAVVGAAAIMTTAAAILLCCLVIRWRRKRGTDRQKRSVDIAESASQDVGPGVAGDGEKNRLVFVGGGGGYSFDLEDLLRASAEVLGKGSTGTSYKAILEDGTTVVVKRLRDVSASRREFEAVVERLSGVDDHPNVLAVRGYYYSKEEKLIIYDYLPAGSLSGLLHGNQGSGRTPMDWDGRLRLAAAAARGLKHLHATTKAPHGNFKASNVLLRNDPLAAAVSDFGLVPLFASFSPAAAGYWAPELAETQRPSFKSDVYGFGVLLLELLTRRSPEDADEAGVELPGWVQSVVKEEWTAEVFDAELARYPGVEDEMVQLLQIAMSCVAVSPESRPDMPEAVRMIEDILGASEADDGTPPQAATP